MSLEMHCALAIIDRPPSCNRPLFRGTTEGVEEPERREWQQNVTRFNAGGTTKRIELDRQPSPANVAAGFLPKKELAVCL
jgi:hypothetical protein